MKNTNQFVAVWLDAKFANIITFEDDETNVQTVQSDIEDYRPKGGSRSKTPWGPMDKISEKKYLERRNRQVQKYFDKISALINNYSQIYLFGPAELKEKLYRSISDLHAFRDTNIKVETADSMTEAQKIAQAKEHFKLKK